MEEQMDNQDRQNDKQTINWNKISQELIVAGVLIGFISIGVTTVLCSYFGIAFTYSLAGITLGSIIGVKTIQFLFTKKGATNEQG